MFRESGRPAGEAADEQTGEAAVILAKGALCSKSSGQLASMAELYPLTAGLQEMIHDYKEKHCTHELVVDYTGAEDLDRGRENHYFDWDSVAERIADSVFACKLRHPPTKDNHRMLRTIFR